MGKELRNAIYSGTSVYFAGILLILEKENMKAEFEGRFLLERGFCIGRMSLL